MAKTKGINSRLVHGTGLHDPLGSVTMPIYQSSTFSFRSAEHGAACFAGEEDGFIYTRIGNPTIDEFEAAIAAVENGFNGIATSSGMAAVNTVYLTYLAQGKHVVCHNAVYGPSRAILESSYLKFGVEATFVDATQPNAVAQAIRPDTALIFLESPANPTIGICDITAICDAARKHKIPVCVDNTFCSPYLQNPLSLGADIVVHSLTKFINGHADIVGGVVIPKREEDYKRLNSTMINFGFNMDPHQAFLVRRGMKTLAIRIDRAQENAMKVAAFLESHPKVEWVMYPGLKSHPHYDLARKQMRGPGTMISFGLKGGVEAGRQMMNNIHFCILAVSLGGIETLIQHPASMTHSKLSAEAKKAGGITDGLVRLSVGIEEHEDIIADLSQALSLI
jgi:methionine-gamma-lyase